MAGPSAVLVGAAAVAGGVLLRRRKPASGNQARHGSAPAFEQNTDQMWSPAYRQQPTLPDLPVVVDQDTAESDIYDPWLSRPQRRPQDTGRPRS